MLSVQYTFLAFISLAIVHVILSKVKTEAAHKKLPGYSHCQPIKRYPQSDDRLGLKWMKAQWKAYNNRTYLEATFRRFEAVGDTFCASRIGNTFIQTRDAENIKTILATNFHDFGLGPRMGMMGSFLGSGIFTTDGKAWEHSRALVRPNFARMQLRNLDSLEHHVQLLIDRVPRDGSMVDLQELFFCLTLDSGTELLFGESTNSLRDTDPHSVHNQFVEAYDFCQAAVLRRPRNALMRALVRDKKLEASCRVVHNYVDGYVSKVLAAAQTREKAGKDAERITSRYVFLEELAKETNDRIRLRDEVLNVLLAGRDTTASLLSNTFHVLARRPDIWTTLSREVDELQGLHPSYEQLRNMTFVRHLLNESLRLYPVVPMNARFATRDTILPHGGGADGLSPIVVAKGQSVSYHVFSMHRRKDIYGEDAEQFRPERWETLRPGWAYLPFNGGPRICPGQQFALTEASYTLVRLVQEFQEIVAHDDQPWQEMLGMTTTSFHGAKVRLQARSA